MGETLSSEPAGAAPRQRGGVRCAVADRLYNVMTLANVNVH